VFANRPLAINLQVGTLFFSSDTNIIYQVYLVATVRTWESMGGGGSLQNLNSVLAQGGLLEDDYIIESDGSVNLNFSDFNNFSITNVNSFSTAYLNSWSLCIDEFKGLKMDATWLYLQIDEETLNGFKVDATGGGYIFLGDYSQIIEGTYLYISNETNANGVYIYDGVGAQSKIYFRYDKQIDIGIDKDETVYNAVTIGDWVNDQTILQVYNGRVYTCSYAEIGTFGIDFNMTDSIARFGAGFGNYSGNYETYMQIEPNNGYLTFNAIEQLAITGSANITTTSNGTAVNQHLKISINGVAYLIQLRSA